MPITFDPNSSIPDEFPTQEPQKPQAPEAQAPKPPQRKNQQSNQPNFQDMVDSVPGLREAASTLLDIPQAIADAVPDIPGVPQPLDLLPKPVGDAVKSTLDVLNTAANPAVGVPKYVARTALQGKKSNELDRAVAGGLVDLGEGIANLPTQVVQGITGRPWYTPINTGLIPENDTTAGEGLRTLARYAFASAIPIPGLGGAAGLGLKAAAQRAGEGFVQGFAAADGSGADETFIGNIPGLRGLQTNEAYNPIANRALIGLEEALTNAAVPYLIPGLRKAVNWWKNGKPASGAAEAQAAIAEINKLGPTLKYGGDPNELVVDGLKAAAKPPSFSVLPETRGQQTFFHGAASPISRLEEGYYEPSNIYGQGFYATDDITTADSYTGKNRKSVARSGGTPSKTIYRVTEKVPVNFYNLDQPVDPRISQYLEQVTSWSEATSRALDELDANPNLTLAELMDEIRGNSRSAGESTDTIQEVFAGIQEILAADGFGGFTHLGGKLTKSGRSHQVKIYWDPANQIDIDTNLPESQTFSLPSVPFTAPSLRPTAAAVPSPAAAPTNFTPVDMTSRNIQSINFENANGQPGFDLWFADKRFPALLPGTVKKIGKQGNRGRGYGNYIVVESIDPKTGDKVDVLYAHLADGGIKVKEGDQVVPGMEIGTQGGTGRVVSSDGTIASVDFLAPAAKESKSMKPYKRFNELRRELAEQIQKGGITPGQAQQVMADAAAAMPTGTADEAIQQADEQLELLTRKQALDAGYEVSELVPVAARNDVNDVAAEMLKRGPDISVTNTARPAVFSLTDNEIRAIGGSSEEALNWANGLAATVDYEKVKALSGLDDIDIQRIRSQAVEQFGDILNMTDDEFSGFLDQISITDKQGRTTVTDEGIFALTFKLNELASQTTDLAKAAENAEINGQNPQALYLRAIDRGMAMMQLEKVANKADSWNLARRGALRNEDTVLTKAAQEQINANQEAQALRDTRLSLMKEARDAILRGDEAWMEKLPAALRALQMVGANPKEQLNVWKTLASAVLKSGDAAFTGSVLTGPATQSLNFQSVLFNGFGQPALAYLSKVAPGPENKQVREEAVAAFSATMDTVRELNNLIPKLWSNQPIDAEMLGREFVGLDQATSRNLERVKERMENGELSDAQATFYNFAIKLHDLIQSPLITGTVRKTIGTIDQIANVIAGRQMAYRRAYLDALAVVGDSPLTTASRDKFARIVEQQRKQHLKAIFQDDGFTLVDDEAKKLADAYAFRTDTDGLDKITKSMIQMAEVPGMKMLGLTFVRSPAAMLKATTQFTPLLNRWLKKRNDAYINGTPFQRAAIDGAEAMSYFIASLSYAGGLFGFQTGAGPLRGQERDSWSESNQPFEYRLGGVNIKYQWLEPLSTVMGFFADLGYYTRYGAEQGLEDNWARGIAYAASRILPSAGSNIINKSYFTQLATLSQLTDVGKISSYKKLGENVLSGLAPLAGLRNQLGSVVDPMYRELRSELTNSFAYFIQKRGGLGLSRFAPEDLDDVTGKPLYKNGVDGDAQSSLLQAFNLFRPLGVNVSKNRFKPVHKYLTEVGIDVSDTRDKILGTPLTNEERTEFTRYMTKGGMFEKELLRYFKSDAYKFDKEESSRELLQGMKPSETRAYLAVQKIINNYTRLAMYEMGKGLTTTSLGFMNRRSSDLQQARQSAFERQQRQIQQLREYPFQ